MYFENNIENEEEFEQQQLDRMAKSLVENLQKEEENKESNNSASTSHIDEDEKNEENLSSSEESSSENDENSIDTNSDVDNISVDQRQSQQQQRDHSNDEDEEEDNQRSEQSDKHSQQEQEDSQSDFGLEENQNQDLDDLQAHNEQEYGFQEVNQEQIHAESDHENHHEQEENDIDEEILQQVIQQSIEEQAMFLEQNENNEMIFEEIQNNENIHDFEQINTQLGSSLINNEEIIEEVAKEEEKIQISVEDIDKMIKEQIGVAVKEMKEQVADSIRQQFKEEQKFELAENEQLDVNQALEAIKKGLILRQDDQLHIGKPGLVIYTEVLFKNSSKQRIEKDCFLVSCYSESVSQILDEVRVKINEEEDNGTYQAKILLQIKEEAVSSQIDDEQEYEAEFELRNSEGERFGEKVVLKFKVVEEIAFQRIENIIENEHVEFRQQDNLESLNQQEIQDEQE